MRSILIGAWQLKAETRLLPDRYRDGHNFSVLSQLEEVHKKTCDQRLLNMKAAGQSYLDGSMHVS